MTVQPGQDRTPKFAGHVLADRTESGPLLFPIFDTKVSACDTCAHIHNKSTAKIGLRKPSQILSLHLEKLGLFLNFKSVKCQESVKEKTRSPESGHLKIPGQPEPDVRSS